MVVWARKSISIAALSLALVACGSSSKDKSGDTKTDNGGSGSSGSGKAGGGSSGTSGGATGGNIAKESDTGTVGNDLKIVFSPMYSGFDGGDHTFKVPAIVSEISGVKWSASDISYVDMEEDPVTGGVMITTRKAGNVKIIARSGDLSGSADLTITEYDPADCSAGEMRYNNSIGIDAGAMALPGLGTVPENASCANCHGEGAMFLDVQHTPEQTGGYSDMDLVNIFTRGFKPEGTQFHTRIPPQIYQRFHTWEATDEEKKGLVCWLRQFEPKPQGMFDFGGLGRPPMGGMMGGGTGGATGGGTGGSAASGTGGSASHTADAGM
jgi:hypothetical protein